MQVFVMATLVATTVTPTQKIQDCSGLWVVVSKMPNFHQGALSHEGIFWPALQGTHVNFRFGAEENFGMYTNESKDSLGEHVL